MCLYLSLSVYNAVVLRFVSSNTINMVFFVSCVFFFVNMDIAVSAVALHGKILNPARGLANI
jgi:hypothetical protein